MAQYEMNLRDYWFIVRRRRVIIAVSTVLTAALSFWWAQQKVPIYQSTAAVKYEQSAALSGLLVEVLSYSSADSIETQVAMIKSTPVLEEVARRLGRLPGETRGEPLRESKAYWSTLDAIGAKLKVARVPSTSILEITATSSDPQEAKQLANTAAQVYRTYSRDNRNARVIEARKFIEGQLKELDGRVRKAEDELWAFREANRVIAPGAESQVLLALFGQVRGDIEKARQQRTELEMIQQRLERDAGSDAVFLETANPAVVRLVQLANELLLERNQLALEFTDRHPRLQALDDRIRQVRAEMRRQVAGQITALRAREEILHRQLGELMQKNRDVPAVELGLARRQREAKYYEEQLALMKTKHQEALIKESEAIEEVAIVRPAADPDSPVSAETFNTVLVGALLGLMVGLVLAFIQETLDTSIGTIEDVESYLEIPVLGVVPHIDPRETTERLVERRPDLADMEPDALRNHALLVTHFDPKSPVAEAYRTLRTNIQFARLERAGKVLLMTSPTLQEGKTTTIVNLALTMAQAGQKVLLVGANLRRPSIYRFFGIEREPGLSDVLLGRIDWHDAVRGVADILMGRFEMEDIMASPGLDNLHIVEAGATPANPSELISTRAMSDFITGARAEYDIVLIDSPPVLPVTDAAIVSRMVDGVLLIYQAGKVGRLVLRRAKVQLEAVGAKVWGIVLNDVHTEIAGYQYTHYYTHYYGEETPATPRSRRFQRLVDAVRSRWPGGSTDDATAMETTDADDTTIVGATHAIEPAARPEHRRRRQSSRTLGLWVLVGVGVAVAGAGIVAWTGGVFDPSPQPRALLRQKMETTSRPGSPQPQPAPAAAPARVAAPAAPAAPPASTPSTPSSPTAPPPASRTASSGVLTGPTSPAAQTPSAAPAPSVGSSQPASPAARQTPAPVAAAIPDATKGRPAPGSSRFAVELGPFFTAAEAERVERRLGDAGYPTVRFRQQTGTTVYGVLIERVPTARDAQALVSMLREHGFPEPVVLGSTQPLSVRVGDVVPLRAAVQLAERLRGAGHQVRVAAQAGEAISFMIRHGNFTSPAEAEAKSQELARLGLATQPVQVK
ncbi:MAG: polysaccharide biosynthesis tyrosine autokinase [Candidatus Rokubacteria bacterium]|nr:polysaccharide biosynthesis tyrosine autokinase [Candidatus Rokubacteria bacterium]